MKIKAIAIDIDGTLTNELRRFDLEAVQKVREIEARGVPVILATGNILCITESAAIFIGTSGCLIAENGGVIKNIKNDETLYLGNLKKVEKAFEFLSKKIKVQKVARSELRKTEIAIYRTVDAAEVKKLLKGFDVGVVDTKFAIHIKDSNVSKGKALLKVAKIMGIKPSEIAAIGDSENDREMLECAGYAISVGEEKLRNVSDFVTRGSLGKGGREALEHVIKLL
ncbi:MAG: phosphoglycolate phosphatase [Candidatus Hydrothermarchaeota archaeon]|nr:phosphoglycolate phosphatase [Candidatus Hydrothermarchaeota archaeon]